MSIPIKQLCKLSTRHFPVCITPLYPYSYVTDRAKKKVTEIHPSISSSVSAYMLPKKKRGKIKCVLTVAMLKTWEKKKKATCCFHSQKSAAERSEKEKEYVCDGNKKLQINQVSRHYHHHHRHHHHLHPPPHLHPHHPHLGHHHLHRCRHLHHPRKKQRKNSQKQQISLPCIINKRIKKNLCYRATSYSEYSACTCT